MHQSENIKSAVKQQNSEDVKLSPPANLKMRPIVAGPTSLMHRLSNFLDLILKPFCRRVASYIRDNMDFLNYIRDKVNTNTILVSLDVIGLHITIQHDFLEAIEHWLDNYLTTIERPFSKHFIL